MLLLKLLLLYTLLYPSIVTAECFSVIPDQENNSTVKGIIQEFATVLQRMQSDTYEMLRPMQSDISENLRTMQSDISDNLRTMQTTTSMNLHTLMSAISKQSASTDANLVNVIDAVESVSDESRLWRNELSEIVTNLLNQTMDIVLKVNSDNNDDNKPRFNKTADKLVNSSIISNTNTNKWMEEIQPEFISKISNQILHNISEIISSQKSSEISMLRETFTETNNALAEMKNITARLLSRIGPHDNGGEILNSDGGKEIKNSQNEVPLGFTKHNGTVFLLPTVFGATTLSWYDSIIRCLQNGAIPFIPRTIEDFKFIQNVNSAISGGKGIWLPASDHTQERVIKWYDGTDASSVLSLFDWQEGFAYDNTEDHDCVNIWTTYGHKLEFESCKKDHLWPMICEII